MKYLKQFKNLDKNDVEIAGGKGASLGEMLGAGIPVPDGFVVLSTTFDEFLHKADLVQEIDAILDAVDHKVIHSVDEASEKIQDLIKHAEFPKDIADEIKSQFEILDSKFVAVRSSATSEDGADHAWAGQLDSYLNTTEDKLLEKVQECWASLFTPRAIFYRFEKGLHTTKISVAVVVQKMVNSEKSGIAFSVHPVTEDRNQLIIEAGFGLGEAIVSGSVTPDSYVVEKEPRRIIDINVSNQSRALYRKEGGGNEWIDLEPEKASSQVLLKSEILEFSEIVLTIENHYGFPCDIEWAYEAGKFYITQSRPITTLGNIEPTSSKDIYFIFEELYNANPMVLHRFIDLKNINKFFEDIKIKARINKAVIRYENEKDTIYFFDKEFDQVSEAIVKIFTTDIDRANSINNTIMTTARSFIVSNNSLANKLLSEDKIDKNELITIWKKMEEGYSNLFKFTWIHNGLDFKDNLFTTYIFNELLKHIQERKVNIDVNESFVTLTTPTYKDTYFVKLEKQLENIRILMKAENVQTKKDIEQNKTISHDVGALVDSYNWLGFGFDGPAWDKDHFIEILLTSGTEKNIQEMDIKRINLTKQLSLTDHQQQLFELARRVIEGTELRKEAMFNYFYILDILFARLSAIVNVSKQELRYVYPREINKNLTHDIKNVLKERIAYHLDVEDDNNSNQISGVEAKTIFEKMIISKGIDFDGQKLTGQTSYPGVVKGTVKIVNEKKDVLKVEKGDILVSIATNPELISAMKKAAAFVTDRGGITCHAAIISRELYIPCIIGTKIATQVLHDGDLVEVDADNGVVRILEKKIQLPRWEKILQRNFPPFALTTSGRFEFEGYKIGPMTWVREREILIRYNTVQMYMIQDPSAFYISNIKDLLDEEYPDFEKEIDMINADVHEGVRTAPGKTLKDLQKLNRLHQYMYGVMLIGFDVAIDIKSKIDEVIKNSGNDFVSYLETPVEKTGVQREKDAISEAGKNPGKRTLEKLSNDFGYLHQDYMGQPWNIEDYKKACADDINLESGMHNNFDISKLSYYEQYLIRLFKKFLYMYEEARNGMVRVCWAMKETISRLGLNPEKMLYMTETEVQLFAENKGEYISDELLSKRKEAFAMYFEAGEYHEYTGKEDVWKFIQDQKIEYIWEEEKQDKSMLKGSIAYKGKAIGKARIVFTQEDANLIEDGEILIAPMTQVEFLSGIRKCGAIVTDEGGIICHAAIVAREFGKPCILNTQMATRVFKNGDLVEVDADNGVVRIIK